MTNGQQPVAVDAVVQRVQRRVKIQKPDRRQVRRLHLERMAARPPVPMAPPATPRVGLVRDRDALQRCAVEAEEAAKTAREELAHHMAEGRRLATRLTGGHPAGGAQKLAELWQTTDNYRALLQHSERTFEWACEATLRAGQFMGQAGRFRTAADMVTRQLGGTPVDVGAPPAPPAPHGARRPYLRSGGPRHDSIRPANRREERHLARFMLELEAAERNVTPAPGESSTALRARVDVAAAA
jgi:hypothetical protein